MCASTNGLTPEAEYWDGRYAAGGRLWGDGPSELARLVAARLGGRVSKDVSILDLGCGYGRDSVYLARELGCHVLGADPSPAAVAEARRRRPGILPMDLEWEVAGAEALAAASPARTFDIVYASNIYQLLRPWDRLAFAAAVSLLARPGGLLYLSTLSPRDPQHYAVGRSVQGEERSWIEHVYLHFCTAEELRDDFPAFEVLDLEERAYEETNIRGAHRHTSWFFEGRRRG